ncbi:MAG: amidohydrolase family protein [Sphingomicrobium sp.]
MKTLLAALLAIAHFIVLPAAGAQPGGPGIAFTNVTLVPMDSERLVPGQTVVVRDGRITAIGQTAAMTLPADLPQIDGNGRFLVPGLAEMHAHVPPNPKDDQWTKDVLFLYVANGIIYARSMLGAPHHLKLRAKAERGEIISPRLLLSGPSFNGNSVASPEAGRKMVAEQKAAGYDFLKIHPGLDRPRYDAVAAAARAAPIPFGGHVPDAVGIERALEAGQRTIDHLDGIMSLLVPAGVDTGDPGFFGYGFAPHADGRRIDHAAERIREAGVWLVATESLIHHFMLPDPHQPLAAREELRFVPKKMRESWAKSRSDLHSSPQYKLEQARRFVEIRGRLIKALNDGGAGLLLGSDSPQVFNVPGFAIHRELAVLVDAGLSPFEALSTGTRNVGRFLDDEHHGIIAKGARADLILLEANPLEDVTNVQRRAGVMLGGRWIPEREIQAGLAQIAQRYAD